MRKESSDRRTFGRVAYPRHYRLPPQAFTRGSYAEIPGPESPRGLASEHNNGRADKDEPATKHNRE